MSELQAVLWDLDGTLVDSAEYHWRAWLGAPPARCIVVEDGRAGIEAARRAGMRCIGVGPEQRCAPDVGAPSLDALAADAFDRLLGGSS